MARKTGGSLAGNSSHRDSSRRDDQCVVEIIGLAARAVALVFPLAALPWILTALGSVRRTAEFGAASRRMTARMPLNGL